MQSIVVNSCTSIRLSNFKATTTSTSASATATATAKTAIAANNKHERNVIDNRNNIARVILKSLLNDYGGGGGQTLKFCNNTSTTTTTTNSTTTMTTNNSNQLNYWVIFLFIKIRLNFWLFLEINSKSV